MSTPNLDRYIGRYDFKHVVCSECKVNGCKNTTFCFSLHNEAREAFKPIFEYMNRYNISFNLLPIAAKLDAICAKCMFRSECFVDNMSYTCIRKLRIQFDEREETTVCGFSSGFFTQTHTHKHEPRLMLFGDDSLKTLLEE